MVSRMWETVCAIQSSPALDAVFAEGKMLGLLMHRDGWLTAYSGKRIEGLEEKARGIMDATADGSCFVPPIYDITTGYFREKEQEISAMNIAAAEEDDPEALIQLKLARAKESLKLQRWTFEQYKVLNARGEEKNVLEIFSDKNLMPPAATGDCAAPKLLQYAYSHGLEPLEIGEFWYGRSPAGPVRAQGRFYPACSWKCGPLLEFMLQGLEIEDGVNLCGKPSVVYEDEAIIVVDKPSGMPAVPGLDGLESLEGWLRNHCSGEIFQVHRLDQDTSGIMVFARDRRSQGILQRQFSEHQVQKSYVALLDGRPEAPDGVIDLPLGPDYEDKPRQKVDFIQGKKAETQYRVLSGNEAREAFSIFGVSEAADNALMAADSPASFCAVEFIPHTGRSHQLRVHAAHPSGLGAPIIGDTLYGSAQKNKRLCLQAQSLRFIHPVSGEEVYFRLTFSNL